MNSKIENIIRKYNPEERRERRIWVNVPVEKAYNVLSALKNAGFNHLSAISATDWLEEGEFEITYHLWSYELKTLITVKTRIPREKPEIKSVYSLWDKNAWIHERELNELFGVNFIGNPDQSPLFLEGWDGPPPFRKDFDWREYVRKKYYNKDREREKAYLR